MLNKNQKLKARTVGQKPAAVVAEVEASVASREDTEEESDSNFGVIDYFVDREIEDGVLGWGVVWEGQEESSWCEDRNIPVIPKYNKMRTAGNAGKFYLKFTSTGKQAKKRGKTKRKERKGGPPPAAVQAELEARASQAVVALQSLPLPLPVAALQSLPPPLYVQVGPPPSFAAWCVVGNTSHYHNADSRCLLTTFASLVGDDKLVTSEDLDAVVVLRKETVYNEGWHSIPQFNQFLGRSALHVQLVKMKRLAREKSYQLNPFLQHQRSGLFIVQASVQGRRAGKIVGHYIGIDCDRRELIDTFLKGRRPMCEKEWLAIGVRDWQATFLICKTHLN